MLQSHIIDIDGVFVGVAVRLDNGLRFIAIDPRVRDIGGTIWPTLPEVRRISRLALLRGQGTTLSVVLRAEPFKT
jgi:hypothetical protein